MTKPFEVAVSCTYGAPMGRHSDAPELLAGTKAHLQRVPFFDGDYDKGGTYWGGYPAEPLFCAWNDDYVTYIRAPDRETAKARLPEVRFFR